MYATRPARHRALQWLIALTGALAIALLSASASRAAEDNPNNYQCFGHTQAGKAEVGSEEQQVQYSIACDGPISGYQLQSQVPLTGVEGAPLITNLAGTPVTTDSFSCSGEVPGYAINCVGNTTQGYETITGQFAIGSKLCAEPRVDPLLTVTYAYLNEKKQITQAISGPFDLGRPRGCPSSALSGGDRLDPVVHKIKKKHSKKAKHGKSGSKAKKGGAKKGATGKGK